MVRSFYTDTVTRLRAVETTNARNDTVLSWDTPTSLQITGCRMQPVSTAEVLANRYESTIMYRLLAPSGSDVTFLDRIMFGALELEVVGPAEQHRSPTGEAAHDEILLRRVTG